MANSKPLHFWSDEETEFMLYQLRDLNIWKYMDGRKTRNGRLFKKVAEQMEDAGFKRSPEQVRVRWKHLKQAYYNAKKNNQTSGYNPVSCTYSEILEELLGSQPLYQSTEHGVDIELIPSVSDSVLEVGDLEGAVQAESPETVQEFDGNSSESSEKIYTPQMKKNSAPLLERATSTPPLDLPALSGETAKTPSERKRRRKSDVELLIHRMQQMQKTWMEQIQRSHEREERLVSSILQSNETVVSALMEGIRSLRSPMPPNSPQATEDNGNTSHISPVVRHLTSQTDSEANTLVNKQQNNVTSTATQTKVASSECGVSTLTFPLDSPQLFLYPTTVVKQPSKRPRLSLKEEEGGSTECSSSKVVLEPEDSA
ncbi:uncharacterized protein LOC121641605 isoform X2 [Melanotaenia boesemani]|uniref:uncharacterized protein LOC121641605 isoform X2 n=1 Tax=Melanotaenia boesemani TaxID=1250792 RepID=UPI001C04FEE7|nr:uncharacterized protein LOC121641605 isoform X2 [Melanotaenia boesemani]